MCAAKPIVCTPDDAVLLFHEHGNGLSDHGSFVIERAAQPQAENPAAHFAAGRLK